MVDSGETVLCEVGDELDEYELSGDEVEATSRSIFDPEAWAEAYEAERAVPAASGV
jgi:hypothetical protein